MIPSLRKLDPRIQWGNPVMFTVYVGAILCSALLFRSANLFEIQLVGWVLTHAHLLNAVWGPKATDQAYYLRVHFAHLRRKLRSAGLAGEVIRNEPGIG